MSLSDQTKKNINETIQKKLGMSYEEFSLLDFDTQQELLKKCRNKNKSKIVMIGSGEFSIFTRVGVTKEENLVKKKIRKI